MLTWGLWRESPPKPRDQGWAPTPSCNGAAHGVGSQRLDLGQPRDLSGGILANPEPCETVSERPDSRHEGSGSVWAQS